MLHMSTTLMCEAKQWCIGSGHYIDVQNKAVADKNYEDWVIKLFCLVSVAHVTSSIPLVSTMYCHFHIRN